MRALSQLLYVAETIFLILGADSFEINQLWAGPGGHQYTELHCATSSIIRLSVNKETNVSFCFPRNLPLQR
jgi:hypothetical protein